MSTTTNDSDYSDLGEDMQNIISDLRTEIANLKKSQKEMRQNNKWLAEALDNLQEGFVIYDDNDQLVLCNTLCESMYPGMESAMVPGANFDDLIARAIELGYHKLEKLSAQDYFQHRVNELRNPSGEAFIQQGPNGRWLLSRNVRTHNGFVIALRTDVNDLVLTKNALQDSEASLLKILDNSSFGVIIGLPDSDKRLYVNRRFIEMFGETSEETAKYQDVAVSYVNPIDLQNNRAAFKRDGHVTGVENLRRRQDGSEFWTVSDWRPFTFSGQDTVMIWIADITERKYAIDQLNEKTEFVEVLWKTTSDANQAVDFDIAIQTCLDTICSFTGWPVGHAYYGSENDDDLLIASGIWHLDDADQYAHFRKITESTTIKPGIAFVTRVLATGEPVWVEDVSKHPTFSRTKTSDQDIVVRAGFAIPVISQDKVIAVLEFFTNEALEKDDELLQNLAHIGIQLGRVFERKKAELALLQAMEEIDNANNGLEKMVTLRTQELQEAKDQGEQAAELAHLGHWVWDSVEDKCISCSEELARIHSVSVEEFLNFTNSTEKDEEWAHPADREHYAEVTRRADKQDERFDIEYRIVARDGRVRHVREIAEPVFNEKGMKIQLRGVVQDITTSKNAEEALLVAMQQAETANQTKTEFLANMSHELRTPLNAIIGFSEMIKDGTFGPLESHYQDYADHINASGEHLLGTIADILDISKVETGKLDIDEEELDLAKIFAACETMMSGRTEEARVTLEINAPKDLPRLYADPLRLKQILLNLIGNAIKFTPEEGVISLTGKIRGTGGVALVVRDSGIGIAEGDIPKALEKFGQVRNGHTHAHEGAGLGLAITKSLVELHGGILGIKSQIGKGTTVTVIFPAERTIKSSG